MASLARLARVAARPLIQQNRGVLSAQAVRLYAYWNKDWAPGPYPKTPEERAKAAKKYGMRPEDYEPYPDDGTGYGDYPKLPYVSGDSRDPYQDWDMPDMKRNFGEPLHVESDLIGEDRWNPNAKPRFSYTYMVSWFFLVIGGISLSYYLTLPYPHHLGVLPKQFPYNDLWVEKGGDPEKTPEVKHYVFEPAEASSE